MCRHNLSRYLLLVRVMTAHKFFYRILVFCHHLIKFKISDAKPFDIQNIFITLCTMVIAIIVRYSFYLNTIKTRQSLLIY